MKKKALAASIVAIMSVALPIKSTASVWQSTKETVNRAIFWKSENLADLKFETVYKKPAHERILQSPYFTPVVLGGTVIAAGTVIYFTAGAGAPAAAVGTSTVATWVAGGGAGAYMSGLSTIGGWFGGNAILGAAILNGISIGVIGGGTGAATTLATMSIGSKVLVGLNITAATLDGVFYFVDSETQELNYHVKLNIPDNLGSGTTRNLIADLNQIEKNRNEAQEQGNHELVVELVDKYNELSEKAIERLENIISNETGSQEDYLVLSMFAWNNMQYDLFQSALVKINEDDLKNASFLNYLKALSYLASGDESKAINFLEKSIFEEAGAIEPVALYINLLGNMDFNTNENKILLAVDRLEKNFSKTSYRTEIGMLSIYYRMATFYYTNEKYDKAEEFYRKALKDLGMIQKFFGDKQIQVVVKMAIANSLYKQGNASDANALFLELAKEVESFELLRELRGQYLGWGE